MSTKILVLALGGIVAGSAALYLSLGSAEVREVAARPETRDHVLGDRSAPVKIIEYAEAECPYCKKLHPILLRVLKEHEGKVSLVYRHFPLTIHPKSFDEAKALECVAEQRGDAGFFSYLERLYQATPSNNGIDLAVLPQIAEDVGIPRSRFAECLASDRHRDRIFEDIQTGEELGVDSVPHLIIIAPNGQEFVFSASPSHSALDAVIRSVLPAP